MEDYRKFYYALFNDITDLIYDIKTQMLDQEEIIDRLYKLQEDAEDRFLDAE